MIDSLCFGLFNFSHDSFSVFWIRKKIIAGSVVFFFFWFQLVLPFILLHFDYDGYLFAYFHLLVHQFFFGLFVPSSSLSISLIINFAYFCWFGFSHEGYFNLGFLHYFLVLRENKRYTNYTHIYS